MTVDISLEEREVHVDPVAALFRVSTLLADHTLRARQKHVGHEVDLGHGLRGKVVAVDYKNVTLKSPSGERREVPINAKRAAVLAASPASSSSSSSSSSSAPSSSKRKTSPKASSHGPGTTTRK